MRSALIRLANHAEDLSPQAQARKRTLRGHPQDHAGDNFFGRGDHFGTATRRAERCSNLQSPEVLLAGRRGLHQERHVVPGEDAFDAHADVLEWPGIKEHKDGTCQQQVQRELPTQPNQICPGYERNQPSDCHIQQQTALVEELEAEVQGL